LLLAKQANLGVVSDISHVSFNILLETFIMELSGCVPEVQDGFQMGCGALKEGTRWKGLASVTWKEVLYPT
jgi:hypothetical protein